MKNDTQTTFAPTDRSADRALMKRVAAGDREAFEELSRHYMPLIYTTSYRVLNHVEDAQDIAHDVLITIWNKADTFHSSKGSLKTWICTMARNRSIDRVRSLRRRSELREDFQREIKVALDTGEAAAEDALFQSESKDLIRDAVSKLSPEQREVIELAYFQGMTQGQISECLERPLGTVKARIRRGMKALRRIVKSHLGGEFDLLATSFASS